MSDKQGFLIEHPIHGTFSKGEGNWTKNKEDAKVYYELPSWYSINWHNCITLNPITNQEQRTKIEKL